MNIEPTSKASSIEAADLQRLRDTAGEAMGNVFFGTMLSAMRSTTLKGEYGHGGRGEEVFSAQLDGILAQQMGKSSQLDLGELVFKAYEKQQRLMSTQQSAASAGVGA